MRSMMDVERERYIGSFCDVGTQTIEGGEQLVTHLVDVGTQTGLLAEEET